MATATKEAPFLLASIFHSRLKVRSRFSYNDREDGDVFQRPLRLRCHDMERGKCLTAQQSYVKMVS